MNTTSTSLSRPAAQTTRTVRISLRAFRVVCATLAVAIAAHISFPLPFTPVPFTLQPLAVLGIGLALGPIDGTLAMLAYLAEGAAGLPVFSPTGPGGLLQLLGPTGGFLFAYPLVAFICGSLTRRLETRLSTFAAALTGCASAVVFLFLSGALWFAHLSHWSPEKVWLAAVLPFLAGEAIKIFAAAGSYRALKPSHTKS